VALSGRNRLAARNDIDEVFKLGKAARGSFLLVKYVLKGAGAVKVAVMVPMSVAKSSVDRNRIKRTMLEAVRVQIGSMQEGCRIVLVAQKGILSEDRDAIAREIVFLIKKANLNNHE